MSAETDAGLLALQSGDVAGAVTQLEQATNTDPNDFQACLYLGAAYGQAGRQMDAVAILTKAVQLQPANAQARYNLAVAMESAGYREQALTAAQQAIQLQPDYPKAQELFARLTSLSPASVALASPGAAATQSGLQQTNIYSQPGYTQPQLGYGQPSYAPPNYGQPVQGQNAYGAPQGASPYQSQGASSYGGPPMGAQQLYGAAPMFQTEPAEANTALVLSILGLVLGFFCCGLPFVISPIAIYYASKAKRQIAMNPNLGGSGKAVAGLVMGIIGSVFLGFFVIYIGIIAIAAIATPTR